MPTSRRWAGEDAGITGDYLCGEIDKPRERFRPLRLHQQSRDAYRTFSTILSPAPYQRELWSRVPARKPSGIHLAGVATVRFSVEDDGALIAVELVASSCEAALDRLALRTVRNAAPFAAPPMGVERD